METDYDHFMRNIRTNIYDLPQQYNYVSWVDKYASYDITRNYSKYLNDYYYGNSRSEFDIPRTIIISNIDPKYPIKETYSIIDGAYI